MSRGVEWVKLSSEVSVCSRCRLSESRSRAVPGEGSLTARLMFIGEAPGKSEDEAGRPFVGAAGKLLNQLLEVNGVKREEVFITNVVKCRPPGNRDPLEDEVMSCAPFTNSIIQLIQPSIITTLGNHSGRYVFEVLGGSRWQGVTRMRGKIYNVKILGRDVTVIPTYHPAAALYNPGPRAGLEEDFKLITSKYREVLQSEVRVSGRRRTLLDYLR
ncbi:MAG: uracil-DNA glycosylase [Zestosphaera sp.]